MKPHISQIGKLLCLLNVKTTIETVLECQNTNLFHNWADMSLHTYSRTKKLHGAVYD